MNGLSEELKPIAPGVHWDCRRDTFYVRAADPPPSDLTAYIRRFRQVLEADPQNTALRFLLAQYLERDGQSEQARAELQRVAQSDEGTWADKARQVLEAVPDTPAP